MTAGPEDYAQLPDAYVCEIANLIVSEWKKPYFGAVPYIDAMLCIDNIDDDFGLENGRMIVAYFLANAGTWRGETARQVKKELNNRLNNKKGI